MKNSKTRRYIYQKLVGNNIHTYTCEWQEGDLRELEDELICMGVEDIKCPLDRSDVRKIARNIEENFGEKFSRRFYQETEF